MTRIPAPEAQEYTLLEPGMYESIITESKVIENDYYDSATQDKKYATRIQWTFKYREGPAVGETIRKWTPSHLSEDPRATLAPFLAKVDKDFDISKGFDTEDYENKPVLLLINNVTKEINGEMKPINELSDIFPSKMGELTAEELVKSALPDAEKTEEIPF